MLSSSPAQTIIWLWKLPFERSTNYKVCHLIVCSILQRHSANGSLPPPHSSQGPSTIMHQDSPLELHSLSQKEETTT